MKDENNGEADILITISSVVLRFYDDDGGDNLCVRISIKMVSNSTQIRGIFLAEISLRSFIFFCIFVENHHRPSVMKKIITLKRVVDEFIR